MGVIYKLRPEIVEYITTFKKNNSKIGCRELALIVSNKFNIEVSKSSINTILKQFELSGIVGRPAKQDIKKKFTIPAETKKQLLNNFIQTGFPQDEKIIAAKEETPKPVIAKTIPEKTASEKTVAPQRLIPSPETKKSIYIKIEEKLKIENKTIVVAKEQQEAASIRPIPEVIYANPPLGKLYDNAGLIVLKSMEYFFYQGSFIADLLKKFLMPPLADTFDNACETILAKYALKVNLAEQMKPENNCFWLFNNFSATQGPEAYDSAYKTISHLKEIQPIALSYKNQIQQYFLLLKGFRLDLGDDTQFLIDASQTSLWADQIPGSCWRALQPALFSITQKFISNNSMLYLGLAPKNMKLLYDLVGAFENLKGKNIRKVRAIDSRSNLITEFDSISAIKRLFACGIYPENGIFISCNKAAKWAPKTKVFIQPANKDFFIADTKTDVLSEFLPGCPELFRVISVWENAEENPFLAIITNNFLSPAEEIFHGYCQQWPSFMVNCGYSSEESFKGEPLVRTPSSSISHIKNVWDIFEQYLSDLQDNFVHYCAEIPSNVDTSDLFASIYSLPGYVVHYPDNIYVDLKVPDGFKFDKELKVIQEKVNALGVKDGKYRNMFCRNAL